MPMLQKTFCKRRTVRHERATMSGIQRRKTATYAIILTTRIADSRRHHLHSVDVAEASCGEPDSLGNLVNLGSVTLRLS